MLGRADKQGKHVKKGWGSELWLHNDELYCGKILSFDAGKRCSLHYHERKHETFYLQSGMLVCVFYPFDHPELLEVVVMTPGAQAEVPPKTVHMMHALEDSKLFEFSTQHFDDDSYRIQKGD